MVVTQLTDDIHDYFKWNQLAYNPDGSDICS